MARRQKSKRDTASYLASLKEIAPYVPSLQKLKRRKTLTPAEKGTIARFEKLLMFGTNLVPLSAKDAKGLKDEMYHPIKFGGHDNERHGTTKGIRAIQLRYSGKDTKVKRVNDDTIVRINGRVWVLWKLDREEMAGLSTTGKKKMLERAANVAFNDPQQFPMERIASLAALAFNKLRVIQVNLWTVNGRSDWGEASLQQFIKHLNENWLPGQGSALGTEPEKWLNGLAILVADKTPNKVDTITPAPVSNKIKKGILKKERDRKQREKDRNLSYGVGPRPGKKRRPKKERR